MEEEEEWRDESSVVECCTQPLPLFSRLALLNPFSAPPDEGIFPDQQELVIAPRGEEESRSLKKGRSKNWTRSEMLKLVSLRGEYDARFAGGGKKVELWQGISEALNAEGIPRDAQQCRDKWEKLCAGYKEVREGSKLKEDFAMFDVLHPLLSGKTTPSKKVLGDGSLHADEDQPHPQTGDEDEVVVDANVAPNRGLVPRKKRRILKYVPVTDVAVVQSLLETVVTKQQKFFRDLLESMDRREQVREQMRQEREDQWRAEDRAQGQAFSNAMIYLANKLVANSNVEPCMQQQPGSGSDQPGSLDPVNPAEAGQKRRSKNWKRAEVLQLIRLRAEMEPQFASGTKRAAVWDELAETLMARGLSRDGKQCREKWDKLTAGFKDVSDGVKEACEMPYFEDLAAVLRKPGVQAAPAAVGVDNRDAPTSEFMKAS